MIKLRNNDRKAIVNKMKTAKRLKFTDQSIWVDETHVFFGTHSMVLNHNNTSSFWDYSQADYEYLMRGALRIAMKK